MNINQKLEKLIQIKTTLMQEIYKQCIESNIDPDTFDYSKYITIPNVPREETEPPENTLGANCYKLSIVDKKIKELQ